MFWRKIYNSIPLLFLFFFYNCSSCDFLSKKDDKEESEEEVVYLAGTIDKAEIVEAMSVFPEPSPFPPEFTNENIVVASIVMRSDILTRSDIITRSDFFKSTLLSDIFTQYFEIRTLDENWSYKISMPVGKVMSIIVGFASPELSGTKILATMTSPTAFGVSSNFVFDISQIGQTYTLNSLEFNSKTNSFETNTNEFIDSNSNGESDATDEDANGNGMRDNDEVAEITIDGTKYSDFMSFDLVANIEKTFIIATTFDINETATVLSSSLLNIPGFCTFETGLDRRSLELKCKPTDDSKDKIGIYEIAIPLADGYNIIARLHLKTYTSQISIGSSYFCVLLDNGSLKCSGDNSYGQLGYGNPPDALGDNEKFESISPVDIGTNTAISIQTGNSHTCVVLSDNSIKCWGANSFGQLGLGFNPMDDNNLLNIGDSANEMSNNTLSFTAESVVTGSNHTCALFSDGSVKCWGAGSSGALGQGSTDNIGNLSDWFGSTLGFNFGMSSMPKMLGAGNQYSCVLLEGGEVFCWGENGSGQLGNGNTDDIGNSSDEMALLSKVPITLEDEEEIISLSLGEEHACILTNKGSVECWGNNSKGQLGQGNTVNVIGDNPLSKIDFGTYRIAYGIYAGGNHTCAILDSGDLKCWGSNGGDSAGVLGNGKNGDVGNSANQMGDNLLKVKLGETDSIKSVAVGMNQTCVLLVNNRLKCWGLNGSGQLGLGDKINRTVTSLGEGILIE